MPLSPDVAAHDQFAAPGAPAELVELHLSAVSGQVIWPDAQLPDGSRGIELMCWPSMAGLSLHGLSGAPVLTGSPQKAIGLIRWNPQNTEYPELAAGALVYAAPAALILDRWPELSAAANMPELLRRLADPSSARDVPTVYANVRALLLAGDLWLNEDDLRTLPAPAEGTSWLLAVDAGQAIIRVERDLSSSEIGKQELAEAVIRRAAQAGRRYAAVLTDGTEWRLYHLAGSQLQMVDTKSTDPRAPGKLLGWLEAILATGRNITPDRDAIESKLGAASPSYKLNAAELEAIYARHRDKPTVTIKRRMWAKLLTTASGTSFDDDDLLFINHTLLVAAAKVIGHAALDIRPDGREVTAAALMSGALFSRRKLPA